MIKMYTARTSEVDEIDEAIGEIKSQIDFAALKKFKKNAGGLIFCPMDFIESGVVAALCAELPFGVIGMSSMGSADAHGYSRYDLILTVLTSDDVAFEVGMTDSIDRGNYAAETARLYGDVRARVQDDPRMIFTFMPYVRDVAGYEAVEAMDAACHGIPLWGSFSSGIDFNYDNVWTICNGKALRAGVAVMFLNGPVEPEFIVSSIPGHSITSHRGVITKSEGAVLREVNGLPFMEYMAEIGLEITRDNMTATPLMMYYPDSEEPVALDFYTIFEDGSVLTGGPVPAGTKFAIGNIDSKVIMESAEIGLKRILERKNRQVTLLLPCMSRYVMLAPNQDEEFLLIKQKLAGGESPFVMGYSGGEICPMRGTDGKLHNRFHNYTFSACVL